MFGINKVEGNEEINELAELASEIWHEYFVSILTLEQIDYMVDKFQSYHAMMNQIEKEGYEYYFLSYNNMNLGYMAIKQEDHKLFLSKLYLHKTSRGKGYASKAFDFLERIAKERMLSSIWLTVNRYNHHTIDVYKRKGFEVIREQVADIGNGYVMDDYVMELKLKEE